MKKFILSLAACCFLVTFISAANFNVTIIAGPGYSNNDLTVNVGDVVTIEAAAIHPLVQVSQATWDANGSTALPGGFSATSNFVLNITSAMAGTTIYYVCANHVGISGMKGKITVNVVASVNENRVRNFNFTVFPNPVTSNSWVNISSKNADPVSLTLYDLNGRMVKQLFNRSLNEGEVNFKFDAANLQKGNYILMMRTKEGSLQKQIVIQ